MCEIYRKWDVETISIELKWALTFHYCEITCQNRAPRQVSEKPVELVWLMDMKVKAGCVEMEEVGDAAGEETEMK